MGGGYLALERLLVPSAGMPEQSKAPLPDADILKLETASGDGPQLRCTEGAADGETALEPVITGYEDEAALPPQPASSPAAICSYHIVYSASYAVPMMLFDAHCPGGAPLEWSQLVALLPSASRVLASADATRWTFLTQVEHPHLHQPWHALHPCQTAARMRLLLDAAGPNPDPDPACLPTTQREARAAADPAGNCAPAERAPAEPASDHERVKQPNKG
ncbi:hypothetical protein WJX81_003738 [Elliptochloris bilobata]|uniref:Ubiquitin-like-conjugating enzyme ATG10 n=1 Tax=Elliptochloris bilobata TaxID=381761 RepID=A0AAW1RFW0_9CHLO